MAAELPLSEHVFVQLLDPNSDRVMRQWELPVQSCLVIGREESADVVIPDQYVSRRHAELRWQNEQWRLVSLGRNGVVVDGKLIQDECAYQGMTFRLGPSGATLRFCETEPSVRNSATLSLDEQGLVILHVDEDRLEQEVEEVANGDYFQQLQQFAAQLRRRSAVQSANGN